MSTELQAVDGQPALTSLSLGQLWKLSKMLIGTGFLPQEIKTPEQALAVMTKGQELRIPPMYALSNIVVVKGKPTCSAELMLALIRRDYGPRAIRIAETTNDHCTVEWRQEGWDGIQSYTFSMHDAQVAGLAGQQTWQKYPAALLRARCISAVARMAFPECIAGMYGPDELSPDVGVTDDGEVVIGTDRTETASPAAVGQFIQEVTSSEPPKQLPAVQSEYAPSADTASHLAPAQDGGFDVGGASQVGAEEALTAGLDAAFTAQAPQGVVLTFGPKSDPQGRAANFSERVEGELQKRMQDVTKLLGMSVKEYMADPEHSCPTLETLYGYLAGWYRRGEEFPGVAMSEGAKALAGADGADQG